MTDIRTLEPGDTYAVHEDDLESMRVIDYRGPDGIWASPMVASPGDPHDQSMLVHALDDRRDGMLEVHNVIRRSAARLRVRISQTGSDWAEITHGPTGEVLIRAHVDECLEYIADNLCESVDRSEEVTGPRL